MARKSLARKSLNFGGPLEKLKYRQSQFDMMKGDKKGFKRPGSQNRKKQA